MPTTIMKLFVKPVGAGTGETVGTGGNGVAVDGTVVAVGVTVGSGLTGVAVKVAVGVGTVTSVTTN